MKAQALITSNDQNFSLEEFDIPSLEPNQVLVRNTYSGVSVGTEFAVIRHLLDWGPFPVCTGYQAVGVVEDTGATVSRFQLGDKVYYRRNFMPMMLGSEKINTCSGTHVSHAIVPEEAEIERLPEGVDDATGSMFVMPSVGYNAVDMAGVGMGDVVVFHAIGLIGLGALIAARLRGAITIAIDLNPKRLEMAKAMGAEYTINASTEDINARVEEIKPGGADVVFEGSGIPDCLDLAFPLTRVRGKFVFLGNYGSAPISFRFLVPHSRQLTAFFPCNDGLKPCRAAVLRNIATGAIPWQKTISHQVTAAEAPALYQAINQNEMPDMMGTVIQWE